MRLGEFINELKELYDEHGDLPVRCLTYWGPGDKYEWYEAGGVWFAEKDDTGDDPSIHIS